MGDSIGLPAFWVMFAILVGGGLFGFVGMLVGVPCFAVIYELSKEGINNVLKKKKLPTAVKLYQGSDKIETLTEPEPEEETESVSEEVKEETTEETPVETEEKSEENPIETEKTKEEKTEE